MFVKTYEFPDSSAIFELKVDKNSVYITYNTNIDKEYQFECKNVEQFTEKLSKTIVSEESIGKLIHSVIKQGELVPVTK